VPVGSVRPIAVAAVFTAATVCCVLVVRHEHVRRVLIRERAAHRLADARLHGDLAVFRCRLDAAVGGEEATRALLAEADLILDEALASSGVTDPYEGGPA
jgi:hypothetical protein